MDTSSKALEERFVSFVAQPVANRMHSNADLQPEHGRDHSKSRQGHVCELVGFQPMQLRLSPTSVNCDCALAQTRYLAGRPQFVDQPSENVVAATSPALLPCLASRHRRESGFPGFVSAYSVWNRVRRRTRFGREKPQH